MKKKTEPPFRKKLKSMRRAAGWSYRDLGEAAGLSVEGVRKIELGHTAPNLESLRRLAKAFGISMSALVDGDPSPEVA